MARKATNQVTIGIDIGKNNFHLIGSGTDLRRHHQEGLLLGVKRTKSGKKRTCRPKCRLLGDKRTWHGGGWNFRS